MSRILSAAVLSASLVAGLSATGAMAQSYTAPAGISAQAASVAPAPRAVTAPDAYDGLATGSVTPARQGRPVRR